MARHRHVKPYQGELATRINPNVSDLEFHRLVLRKLKLLRAHYDADPTGNPTEQLAEAAVAMAFAHVPGFRFAKRTGRPRGIATWSDCRLIELVNDVEESRKPKETIDDTLSRLAKHPIWKHLSLGTLRRQYYEGKKQKPRIYREIFEERFRLSKRGALGEN